MSNPYHERAAVGIGYHVTRALLEDGFRVAAFDISGDRIEALVRSLRFELHGEDVHVTLMHPPLTNTRSGAELGYPASMMKDPVDVGRKLARRIDATDAAIYIDWSTRIGLFVTRHVPSLVRRGSERFGDAPAAAASDPDAKVDGQQAPPRGGPE